MDQQVFARGGRPLNNDQVAWLIGVLERYIPPKTTLSVSREREMTILGCLYEIMEVANLNFEDEVAKYNATPRDIRVAFNPLNQCQQKTHES